MVHGMAARLLEHETRLRRATRHALAAPAPVSAAKALSTFGEHAAGWLAVGSLGMALDSRRRGTWVRGATAVAGAHVTASLLKRVVRRRRPADPELPALVTTLSDLSFPSSHAASSAAAAVAYHGVLPPLLLVSAAAAMGVARVSLGAHHPGDVLAGAALGAGVATLTLRLWPGQELTR